MPVFNGAAHLELAMRSMLEQSFADFEVIAVDDGSTDGSWAILEAFAARDARVKPHRLARNAGHAVASNTAIEHSRGQFVARLDQDDLVLGDRLGAAVEIMQARPDVGLVHSDYFRWLPEGGFLRRTPPREHLDLRRSLLFGNVICHSAVTMRRSALDQLDAWYRDLPGPQDYDLWIRLLAVARAVCIERPLAVYRQEAMVMSAMYGDRMNTAVSVLSAHQLEPFVPADRVESVRRLYRLHHVEPADRRSVTDLHRLFTQFELESTPATRARAEGARRDWTRRALRAALAPRSTVPRDPRLVCSIVANDPRGAIRTIPSLARRRVA